MRLDVKAFAGACALIWGFYLFSIPWWVMLFDGATGEATGLGRVYRGFSISPTGSLIGLGWGLFDGLVAGALVAWLYNRLSRVA